MKSIGVVLVAVAVVLEALVISGPSTTPRHDVERRGRDYDGQRRDPDWWTGCLAKGTYVMTNAGLVRLPWHWLLRYAYATVPAPLAIAALGIYLARRTGAARRQRGAADA